MLGTRCKVALQIPRNIFTRVLDPPQIVTRNLSRNATRFFIPLKRIFTLVLDPQQSFVVL